MRKGSSIHTLTKEESIFQSSFFREALAIRNFHEHPLESRGDLKQVGQSKVPTATFLRLKENFRQRKEVSNSHTRVWRERNSETNFHP